MKFFLTVSLAAVLLFAGCKSKTTESTPLDTTQINKEGVSHRPLMGYDLVSIQDKANEMSADLFRGSYNDSLLDVLMPTGSTPSSINVFLAQGDAHTILFDAGLGTQAGGHMMEKLEALKVKPDHVDLIYLTHLHGDHIGGLVKDGQPVFSHAQIYLSVEEFEAWSDEGVFKERNGQWKQVLACYANRINLFQDGDTLPGPVVAHLAPGHTPGHTVYSLDDVLIVGDLFHAQDLQLVHPEFSPTYDNDPTLARQTRQQWLETARTSHTTICGMHLYTPFLQL